MRYLERSGTNFMTFANTAPFNQLFNDPDENIELVNCIRNYYMIYTNAEGFEGVSIKQKICSLLFQLSRDMDLIRVRRSNCGIPINREGVGISNKLFISECNEYVNIIYKLFKNTGCKIVDNLVICNFLNGVPYHAIPGVIPHFGYEDPIYYENSTTPEKCISSVLNATSEYITNIILDINELNAVYTHNPVDIGGITPENPRNFIRRPEYLGRPKRGFDDLAMPPGVPGAPVAPVAVPAALAAQAAYDAYGNDAMPPVVPGAPVVNNGYVHDADGWIIGAAVPDQENQDHHFDDDYNWLLNDDDQQGGVIGSSDISSNDLYNDLYDLDNIDVEKLQETYANLQIGTTIYLPCGKEYDKYDTYMKKSKECIIKRVLIYSNDLIKVTRDKLEEKSYDSIVEYYKIYEMLEKSKFDYGKFNIVQKSIPEAAVKEIENSLRNYLLKKYNGKIPIESDGARTPIKSSNEITNILLQPNKTENRKIERKVERRMERAPQYKEKYLKYKQKYMELKIQKNL